MEGACKTGQWALADCFLEDGCYIKQLQTQSIGAGAGHYSSSLLDRVRRKDPHKTKLFHPPQSLQAQTQLRWLLPSQLEQKLSLVPGLWMAYGRPETAE